MKITVVLKPQLSWMGLLLESSYFPNVSLLFARLIGLDVNLLQKRICCYNTTRSAHTTLRSQKLFVVLCR